MSPENPVSSVADHSIQEMLDVLSDGFFLLDADWRFVWVNRAAAAWSPHAREEFIGQSLWAVFPELVGSEVERRYRAAMETGQRQEFEFGGGDGEHQIWFEITVEPMRDGLCICFHEVTSSRRTRDALEASETAYRTLIDAIPQQVWTANADGELDLVNKQVVEYFGPEVDVLGDGWQAVIHPDELASVVETWTRSLRTGESYQVEFRLRDARGSYRWHLGRAAPQLDASGQVVKWFGTNTEIHQRLVAEASRDELMKVVSHDLRNPMNVTALAAALLRRTDLPSEARERQADAILGAVETMKRLVDDLVDVGRIDEGQLTIEVEPTSLRQLVQDVMAVAEPVASTEGVDLQLRVPASLFVLVDPHRMGQVLHNLVGNAIRYTPAGGRVTICAEAVDGALVVQVRDTGPGIADDAFPYLFDRFWRRSSDGLGLGLAIAHGIVLGHGGTLRAYNADGAVFEITLPL